MASRIQSLQRLGTFTLCLRPAASCIAPPAAAFQPLVQKANLSRKEKEEKRKQRQDPYKWQISQQRKAANVKRKEELKAERDQAFGSPVHGITTPFVESLDSAGHAPLSSPPVDEDGNPLEEPHELPTSPHVLNYLVSKEELDEATAQAYTLNKPMVDEQREGVDPVNEAASLEKHEDNYQRAVVALQRIVSMENASSKDRRHANIRRIIETFGRHHTDDTLRPTPKGPTPPGFVPTPRGGPDTGSSEVQIAILTAKIRAVSQQLESHRGYRDKHNKRNLQVLVHKRQKLLLYMKRKERNSDRWKHLVETLGLSPATYEGQITL